MNKTTIVNPERYDYYLDRKTYLDQMIYEILKHDPKSKIDYVLANNSQLFDMLVKYKQYEDICKDLPKEEIIYTKRVINVPYFLSPDNLDLEEPVFYLSGNIIVADICYIHKDNFKEMRKKSGARYYLNYPLEYMPSNSEVFYSSVKNDPINLDYMTLLMNTANNKCIIDSRSYINDDYEIIY